jgi:chromosome segregation protein
MRLKSLDVVGFKSFFEPTTINFSPGITAVVGPNGCGKSNVVDAIRWVLGEQAPTRLRGKSTEDLLYAGNESNPPAGMAEVTFTLEAVEGRVLPEPYASLSEVAVTRRVYRSGESEYQLNRIPCRLKDITEFFMAAQIHSRGYALVEQGRIDEIIQAKPSELRAMVEEAAGLALFKGRREMSERKLERVRENLARVDDVLKEIERQLNYARRQAKKAETYKIIRAELGELEQFAIARRILANRDELSAQSALELDLAAQAQGVRTEIEVLRGSAAQSKAALASIQETFATTERELGNLTVASDERARTRGFLTRRLQGLKELAPNLARRMTELDAQATAARAARAIAGARHARLCNAKDADGEAKLGIIREQYRAAEQTVRSKERQLERIKDELAELMRNAAVTRGRLGDLAGERAENQERLERLQSEAPELNARTVAARETVQTLSSQLIAAREAASQCEVMQGETAEREFQLRTAIEQSARRLEAARETRARAMVRAQPITPGGAEKRLHGVLQRLNGDGPSRPPTMLLDVVKAPPALEPALRAVLGEQLDAAIIESPGFALRAIEILKEHGGGRLSFLNQSIQAGASAHPAIEAPGVAGRLLEMVEVEPDFEPFVEALIGHVMLADDLNAAMAASNLNGRGTVFVTREGDLLWPDRMISGGSGTQVEAGEVDMRQRTYALELAEQSVALAEQEHEELLRSADWARRAVQDELKGIQNARRQTAECEQALSQARSTLAKLEHQTAFADANRASVERRAAEIVELVSAANARLEEFALTEQSARARLAAAAAELAECRAEARRLSEVMLELGAQVEARKAALNAAEQEIRHQRENVKTIEAQYRSHREEIIRTNSERAEFTREIAELAAQDETAQERLRELRTALETMREQHQSCSEKVAAQESLLKAAEERVRSIDNKIRECQLAGERARTLLAELERGFAEKFHCPFEDSASWLEEQLAGRNPEQDELRLAELRGRAERIGEVNLAAESEVKELEERAGSIGAERADLQAAADDLTRTIQKLNREARKRFAETFEGAAQNFAELFPKLLRGGKGHLELTNADDVLEAGINILVQPPGKRIKEIGLLSGGEKALSAMALIFSLFLLNPSPFCVMDEVDAPLDEFSLAAFTGLVRELKSRSQFIIITHNQRTMQAADQIHGVTMERPGISRIISLKIPQAA